MVTVEFVGPFEAGLTKLLKSCLVTVWAEMIKDDPGFILHLLSAGSTNTSWLIHGKQLPQLD